MRKNFKINILPLNKKVRTDQMIHPLHFYTETEENYIYLP